MDPTQQLPPHVQIIQMGTSLWISRMVWAAAELGIADHIGDTPRTAADLAPDLGLHAHSLHRLLRSLASFGIFSEDEHHRFHQTPMSEALKKGAPGSASATIRTMVGPAMYHGMGEFMYSLQTGLTAFEKAHGKPLFDYLAEHQDEASLFSESMVGIHGAEPPAVAEAYDFSHFGTIVDVGGATGNMLAHILTRHRQPKGLLYDRPHVVVDAPALIAAHDLTDRIDIAEGNFFESVPTSGDAYILSHIIHDWNEDQCLTILGNCRKAMKPTSKLLIVEFVLPEGNTPHFGKLADMVMLALPGGEERTAEDYRILLAKAGFHLDRVVGTASPVSIVEASIATS